MGRMNHADALRTLLLHDHERLRLLSLVHGLALPDCWIAAGFVRNAVWDHLHGRAASAPAGDVDVIWFDCERADAAADAQLEQRLRALAPEIAWSVKNQARMHTRNGDAPYLSSADAMRHWPETATASAVRLAPDGTLDVAAPYGLDDLFALALRPGVNFHAAKQPIFTQRIEQKQWLAHWPLLQIVAF